MDLNVLESVVNSFAWRVAGAGGRQQGPDPGWTRRSPAWPSWSSPYPASGNGARRAQEHGRSHPAPAVTPGPSCGPCPCPLPSTPGHTLCLLPKTPESSPEPGPGRPPSPTPPAPAHCLGPAPRRAVAAPSYLRAFARPSPLLGELCLQTSPPRVSQTTCAVPSWGDSTLTARSTLRSLLGLCPASLPIHAAPTACQLRGRGVEDDQRNDRQRVGS